jgi:hypothetical protein
MNKPLRGVADLLAAAYFVYRFWRQASHASETQTIIFSRGAFRRDVPSIGKGTNVVVIYGEWLRRFLRAGVPDSWLEQMICLGYRSQLREAFPLTLKVFRRFANRSRSRIVFGGVDYFEVAIFAQREFYRSDSTIEAVYHENYAIDYVLNVNLAFYQAIRNIFLFDSLYTYGPPATTILSPYTKEPQGPRPMVMPRLARMEDDTAFHARLDAIDAKSFSSTVLLLAFPGTEYLAPLCFTATLLDLMRLGRDGRIQPLVKFKNSAAASVYVKQTAPLDRHIRWVTDGSVEELVWQAGFTVVFNSIALYEALLGPTIIIIPAYMDSRQDPNLLQETPASVAEVCGELQSVRFAKELEDVAAIVEELRQQPIARLVAAERQARKKLVSRKFYLKADIDRSGAVT